MNKKQEFLKSMNAAGIVFDKEISAPLIEVYWQALESYSDEDVKAAFDNRIRKNRFFPKPAELIDAIEGTTETRTAVAWATLKNSMSGIGAYASVQFNDPVIHSVVEAMGGWIDLCRLDLRDLHFREREFKQLYEAFSRRDSHPEYLCGEIEGNNRQRGYLEHIPEPALIQLNYIREEVAQIEHQQDEPAKITAVK